MGKDNLKITIEFGDGKKIETDSDTMGALAKAMKNKRTRKAIIKEALKLKEK